MVLEQTVDTGEMSDSDFLSGWYKSSERSKHPHHKKLRVECSLDDDIVLWLKGKTNEAEEYPMYINYYLRKIMDSGFDKHF